jgi:predicted ATP-grasp superfamily ATP-dependent carboligase
MDLPTALVLAGSTGALAVVRTLGRRGVPVVVLYYNPRDIAQHSRWVRDALVVPHPELDETGFVARLVACAERYPNAVVFPMSDETALAVARHWSVLSPLFRLAAVPLEITDLFIEKRNTYALARDAGVAHPQTQAVRTADDVARYMKEGRFPCVVKPSQGHVFDTRFGIKMLRVETPEALPAAYRTVVDVKTDLLLQEYIPGGDDCGVNYNAYFWDGEPRLEFTAAKVRNGPPVIGSPRVAVSRVIPDVLDAGRAILRAMRYQGFACVEFKRDPRNGVYVLMEVNGRHNMSTQLAVSCGIDFPWLHYRHLVTGELPSPTGFREGVYWIDMIRDIGYSLTSWRREGLRLRDYFVPYWRPHVFAIVDRRDLGPLLSECRVRLGQAAARLRGRPYPASVLPAGH